MKTAALVLLAVGLAAHQPVLLRVTTRLVQVSVVVTDKKGQPVAGLTRDDFTVTEDGRPQKITSFSVETLRVLAKPAEPLPPDIYTNRYELKGGAPSSVTVILLDLLNTSMRDKVFARIELLKYLRVQLRPEDRVALYALGSQLHLIHDYTSDAEQLIRALDRYKGRSPADLDAYSVTTPGTGNKEMDEAIMKIDQIASEMHAVSRVNQTAAALTAIAGRVAALPGRKNLVWITGGIPFSLGLEQSLRDTMARKGRRTSTSTVRFFNHEVEGAARALDAANVAVYPVDAKGLVGMPALSSRARGNILLDRARMGGGVMPDDFHENRETMMVLANRTGGRAMVDSNDLAGAIRTAVDDSKVTYQIAYSPDHDRWDGHFQKLKVEVHRPAVSVRHRGGYFAFQEDQSPSEDREAAVLRILANPSEATGIRLVVAIRPETPAPGRLGLRTMIELADLTLLQSGGRWTGRLDMAYLMQSSPEDTSGKLVKDDVTVNLSPADYVRALETGLVVQKDLNMKASAFRVKVVARDRSSGAAGSVDIRTKR